ncbi:MAG: alpha/beta fold hydrolase [Ignavibacteriaceae bacterium]
MNKLNRIHKLEKIIVGGIDQWILIRGNDSSKPVLLFIQSGPGFPIISEASSMEKILKLEDHFVVVYWDQRACGKSFSRKISTLSLSLDQMVSDTHELIEKLKIQMNVEKIYVVGFSIGGTIGALAACKYPGDFYAYVGVGIDIKMDEAEKAAYNFALEHALKKKNKKALKELQNIGQPPHIDNKKFLTRVKWITNFGGVNLQETFSSLFIKTMKNILFSSEYSITDIIRTVKGMEFSQKYLLKNLSSLNLFNQIHRIDVPVYIFQGVHDFAAPLSLAEEFFRKLEAPNGKQFIRFENSAHMPHYEEPEKFHRLLIDIIKNGH